MKAKVLLVVVGIAAFASAADCQSLFWTEVGGDKIDTSKFNGVSQATVLSGLSSPYAIALDASTGMIYWTDVTGGHIYRSNRDGTGEQTYASGLNLPRGIAIDNTNGIVYWIENGSKMIRSSPASGGSITNLVTTGLSAPTGIAVDEKNGKIYWTDNGGTDKYIGMCSLNGSGVAHIESVTSFISGIAVDTVHSKIYWTEYGTQKKIMSAALDGSDTATVLTLSSSDPRGIIVMGSAGLLYWTNYLTNTIESANLDGSNAQLLVSSGLNNPLSMLTTSSSLLVAAFEGYPGTALYFDGSSNYVNAGSSSSFNFTGSFTVEAWFKVTSFPFQWDALVTKGDDSWRIARSNFSNNLAFSTNGLSNVDMTGTTNVNDGNWHFFAAVYNGSTKTLYVDGKVDASVSVTGTLSSSTFPVYFGENAGHTGRNFNGDMDEVRIWTVARTEQQVRADMFTTVASAQPNLLAYWQFNDGTGTTVAEPVSGSNGTINGADNWVTSTAPVGQYGDYDASISTDSVGPTGAKISMTISSIPDSLDFVGIYSYGSPVTATTSDAFPGGVTKRSSLVWGLYAYGTNTATYSMNYPGINGITNQATLFLLGRSAADGSWSNLTEFYTQSTLLHDFESSSTSLTSVSPSKQFALGAGNDNSLAVQLSSYQATTDVGSVTLTWKTASEADIAGFNILRRDPAKAEFVQVASYLSDASLKSNGTVSRGGAYQFTDAKVKSGSTYDYRIQSVTLEGAQVDLNTITVTVDLPKSYALYQNYPNPFNPTTTVRFDLKEASTVTLEIYNVLGQRVMEQEYGTMSAGRYDESISMGRFSSGVYYYRISAVGNDGQKFTSVKKLVLMK
ncbi:MAG TPA: LamG-like jellyroll fold domain-containing protein [Candidatus Kryptonia bacterium]